MLLLLLPACPPSLGLLLCTLCCCCFCSLLLLLLLLLPLGCGQLCCWFLGSCGSCGGGLATPALLLRLLLLCRVQHLYVTLLTTLTFNLLLLLLLVWHKCGSSTLPGLSALCWLWDNVSNPTARCEAWTR
jgi:hypothetical protein